MNLEQLTIPFDKEKFKKKIEVLIEKYAFAVENQIHNYHSGEDKDYGDEQKTMQNDMEKCENELVKAVVIELKTKKNYKEILDVLSEVFFDKSSERGNLYDEDDVINDGTEAHFLKRIIIEALDNR